MSEPGAPAFEEPDFSHLASDEDENELDIEDDDDVEEDDDVEDEVAVPPAGEALPDGNAAPGGAAASVLGFVATSIAEDKEAVVVETESARGQLRLRLHVAPADMGRVIGRRGRTAQAVRTLVRAAAASEGQDVFVDIVD